MTVFDDPDDAIERVQRDIAAAQERAVQAQGMAARVEAVRGTARSSRGEVDVQVDASGLVRDLELSNDAMMLRPVDLAALIIQTIAAAQRDAGAQAVEVATATFGAGSSIAQMMASEVKDRFGPPPGDASITWR